MRYPKAFEAYYLGWLEKIDLKTLRTPGHYEEADEIIFRMKEDKEVKTLQEGERRLRKMLYFEWMVTTPEGVVRQERK